MGIYIYSLRAKKVPVVIDGVISEANLYAYSYRYNSAYETGDYSREEGRSARAYMARVSRSEKVAREAFKDKARYAILCNETSADGFEGCEVYDGILEPSWSDCFKIPMGPLVGWARRTKLGRKAAWMVNGQTDWAKVIMFPGGTMLRRVVVADGEAREQLMPYPSQASPSPALP